MASLKSKTIENIDFGPVMSKGNVYLIAYNVFQTLGWMILLIQTINWVAMEGLNIKGLWEETNIVLKIFQTLAILEIVHAAVGLVRSNVMVTTFQVFSRIFVLWAICNGNKAAQINIGYLLLLIAWCVTEVTRYSFYFLNILNSVPYVLTYLRYTLFIALYPLGVTGELFCMYAAGPSIARYRPFSVNMPNKMNFAFDFYYATIVIALLYIPIFPKLYFHMFALRKKTVGTKEKSA